MEDKFSTFSNKLSQAIGNPSGEGNINQGCSQYLVSLGLAWAERGMGASYI